MKLNILILGSTGSIGTQTLEVLSKHKDKFSIWGLVCRKNEKLLKTQAKKFKVKNTCLTSRNSKKMYEFIKNKQVDLVVNGISGSQGLKPTITALKTGKILALANKESIVLEGKKIMALLKHSAKLGAQILPLDSEHHAILRLLQTRGLEKFNPKFVKKITLTASGGPFAGYTKSQLRKATLHNALKHPNWKMGPKILIESATLLNKGYEIIEAHYLFNCPLKNLDAIIDRKSYIHAIVEFKNPKRKANPKTYSLALAYKPDMKIIIEDTLLSYYFIHFSSKNSVSLYHYNDTNRSYWRKTIKILTQKDLSNYKFYKIDHKTFPAIRKTLKAFKKGYIKIFYRNSERAINKYLKGERNFLEIC